MKKYSETLEKEKQNFTHIAEIISQKEKDSMAVAKQSISERRRSVKVAESQRGNIQMQVQEDSKLKLEINYYEEMVNDREKDIGAIEKVITQLRDIVIDASKEVVKQGDVLDVVVGNITESKENIKKANKELHIAHESASEDTNTKIKMCILLVLLIILILLLIIAVA
eukprot:TRINITY_DN3647_c0_g1_i4.p1 TRINITY_DN3647_c0_g1~~TRINITY_DN3647_c0_g1_i4.p1  ORF type:complete len:168 (-),score=44.20 TRINITY_DN3647_c0_g1_i4:80-583(-)